MQITIITRKPKFREFVTSQGVKGKTVNAHERRRLALSARALLPVEFRDSAAVELDYGFATGTRVVFDTTRSASCGM